MLLKTILGLIKPGAKLSFEHLPGGISRQLVDDFELTREGSPNPLLP
jgi:hypothetical protein